jgi:hypothetical protein
MGRPRKKLVLSLADWAPLDEAYGRVNTALRSGELASRDLLMHLREGQLPSAMRRVARDGTETSERLKPSFWQDVEIREEWHFQGDRAIYTGRPMVRLHNPAGFSMWFFVARAKFDRLFPVAGSAEVASSGNAATKPRPGPKPKGDWPTVLAAWLIKRAAEEPKQLLNIDALVTEFGSFLDEKLGWAPQDPKQLRRKIKELLQFFP